MKGDPSERASRGERSLDSLPPLLALASPRSAPGWAPHAPSSSGRPAASSMLRPLAASTSRLPLRT